MNIVPLEHPPPGRTVLAGYKERYLFPSFKAKPFDEVARKKHRKKPDLHPVENVVGFRGEEIGGASEDDSVATMLV